MQGDMFGGTGRTDAPEVLADLEVDYTPPAVAVHLLLALREELDIGATFRPRVALDPAAGSGCWGRAMRAVFGPKLFLIGVEPRASESENLRAAYDDSTTSRIGDILPVDIRAPTVDLVATNPPFSAFEDGWWFDLHRRGWLARNAVVAFYGLSQWGQGEAAQSHLRAWPPALQLRVGGRVAHRGGGQADAREYSLWVWLAGDRRPKRAHPSWRTVQLPVLPTELRRWSPSAVPGTYPIDPALVERIQMDL